MPETTVVRLLLVFTVSVAAACGGVEARDSADQSRPRDAANVPAGDLPGIRLVQAFPRLSFTRPIYLGHAPGRPDRLFVIEQPGRILMFESREDVTEASEFLDIRQRVSMRHNEEGLLDLEFHPDFATNGEFFVWYSATDPRRTILSRFKIASDDPDRGDPDSEEILLEVEQPWGNHNGGTVLFGPDGYLYLSIGDGGWANDPRNYSQNLGELLGTIIRIDVGKRQNVKTSKRQNEGSDDSELGTRNSELPYAIPSDNPFVDREGARPEIWAYGLRNVWRMSFDRETGELWAADVGQDAWEAVYVIEKGGNYGWNIREGSRPFRQPRDGEPADAIIDPVVEYPHRLGKSITGGYVYRGKTNDRLRGAYLYADYVTGRIWAVRYEGGSVTAHREVYAGRPPRFITSFGEDAAGEMYIVAFDHLDGRGGREGRIYRIVEE